MDGVGVDLLEQRDLARPRQIELIWINFVIALS
jgi:hypothetical protein